MLGISECQPARVNAGSPVLAGKDGVFAQSQRGTVVEGPKLQCPLPYLVPNLSPQFFPYGEQQESWRNAFAT